MSNKIVKNSLTKIHVDKGLKLPQKPLPPLQPEAQFSHQPVRRRDIITIAGIESDTSYQEYQWPMFAVKELSDNAVDFLKENYPNAASDERKIATTVKLDTTIKPKMLRIAVHNSNVGNLPVFQNLDGIFDYDNWVSTKRNQHRMTAGGLGDFLKRVSGNGICFMGWAQRQSQRFI